MSGALPIDISEYQADYKDTEHSTVQTVGSMGEHIRRSMADPLVQQTALGAIAGQGGAQSEAEACAAVWAWCKQNITFVNDEVQLKKLLNLDDELELLISPSVMLRPEMLEAARGYKRMEGDCDCFVMTLAALIASLGITPLIKTYKCDRQEPWRWSHVCAAALLSDGQILPLDASHGDYPGWEVPAHDVHESQLWDISGRKVGPAMKQQRRSSGLNGYVSEPGWSGQEATSRGSVAGPYSWKMFPQLYGRGGRLRGLQGIARRKYGLGACVGGFDEYGMACTDFTPITSDPTATAAALQYLNTPTGTLPSTYGSGASAPLNWNALFNSLIGAGTKLGGEALLPTGSTMLPSGAIIGAGGAIPGTGISSSTLLLVGGLLIGGLVLVSAMKK